VATWLTQVSVIDGPVYLGLTLAAVAGAVAVLAVDRKSLRWWVFGLAAAVTVGLVGASVLVLDVLWRPWPEPLPARVVTWSALAVAGVTLATIRLATIRRTTSRLATDRPPSGRPATIGSAPVGTAQVGTAPVGRWRRRIAFATAGAVALVWGLAAVNREYGYLPTVGTVLGIAPPNTAALPQLPPPQSDRARPRPGQPLETAWHAPPNMPTAGRVVRDTPIPGVESKFPARSGWVYLPPAYLVPDPPALPVLVLIAGQPGTPRNWFDGGRLAQTMDRFAAQHAGLAPIVVVPDPLGDLLANPMCLDSTLGQAETYLARDVPAWIRKTFAVDPDPAGWAIGGFSFGGTCGLQLVLRAPDVYRLFLNIAGQEEPTLGSRSRTVNAAFGGDDSAFRRVNPIDEMTRERYPDTAGVFVVGTEDGDVKQILRRLDEAAVACGMDTRWIEVPGRHSWPVAAEALEQALPWLARRMWITQR
jgi:S-formylglutathione hydrolase FrmB